MGMWDSFEAMCRLLVRSAGAVLLLLGLWLSCMVLLEAWKLYKEPERIEHFSVWVEKGMQIDATLHYLLAPKPTAQSNTPSGDPIKGEVNEGASSPPPEKPTLPKLSISYLLGCIILLLLLLLIARIALAAVGQGAKLLLQSTWEKSKG